MLRLAVTALAILCVSCGGDDNLDSPAAVDNRPPAIESIAISPVAPTAADSLSLAVRAQDPDRDPIDLEIEWYRNGGHFQNGGRKSVAPFSLQKGDRIHAIAHASDGKERVSRRSPEVVIVNTAPQITSLRLAPETALAADPIRAIVEAADIDRDELEYRYRWYVDDEHIAIGDAELPPLTATRGKRVAVEVAAFDGEDLGVWIRSDELRIGNSAPNINTNPAYTLNSDGLYQYAVDASDPDGDRPLKYELIQSPPGMQVDSQLGVVTWEVPGDAKGTFPIELSVSDPHGARTLQRYSLDLSWEVSPADTP